MLETRMRYRSLQQEVVCFLHVRPQLRFEGFRGILVVGMARFPAGQSREIHITEPEHLSARCEVVLLVRIGLKVV